MFYCKGIRRSNFVADEGEVKRSLKKFNEIDSFFACL